MKRRKIKNKKKNSFEEDFPFILYSIINLLISLKNIFYLKRRNFRRNV